MVDLPEVQRVDSPAQTFVGLVDRFHMSTRDRIPALYDKFFAAEAGIAGAARPTLFGISLDMEPDGHFRYAVAREVSAPGAMPDGFEAIENSAGPYAVYGARIDVAGLPAMFDAIFSGGLERDGLTLRSGLVYERYPEDDGSAPGMLIEIWIPVA